MRAVLEELIDRVPPRPAGGVARLPIDRSFVLPGFGTVVTGTLASGALRAGDEVEVLPAGRRGRIRGLQTHRRRVDEARAGQRTAVNLQGLDRAQAPRGAVVTHPGSLWTTRRIRASARFLPGVLEGLGRGGPVRFHQGTSERAARLKVLHGSGTQREIEIAFKAETVLLPGDRFILRRPAPLDTLGGGIVLDIRPPRGRARSPEVPEDQALGVYAPVLLRVAREGSAGKSMSDLALELGWTAAERDGRLEEMTSRGVLVRAGERVFDPGTWRGLEQSLRDALGDYHAREPLRTGMSREELRVAVRRDLAQDVWRALLEESAARGELRLEADRVALATHRVVLSAADRDAGERIEQRFRDAGLDPPDLEDVLGIESAQRGARLIEVLVSQGRLVRIRDGRLFHAAALVRLRERLKEHARTSRTIDVAGFKELFGVTRRNAIPLLEQLDAERSTRRVGNVREILIA